MRMRALLATGLCLLAIGCGRSTDGPTPVDPASFAGAPIVLLSIDTLRSDHLPIYGYDGVDTPAIDALRRDAILFERAYTHYPLTFPAHVSMLSGLLPTEHGVRDNMGYAVPGDLAWLPAELQSAGYATGGAVSAYILRGDTGMNKGFDFYEDALDLKGGAALGESQRPGTVTTARAIEWLEGIAGPGSPDGKPFFLFLHLYEPHTPYEPPEPFASRYRDPYDGEIAAADAIVDRLVAALRRLGVYDQTLFVLTSDHGEGLRDHGELEHGILLYREAIQVPLLVKLPHGAHAGDAVRTSAQTVDIPATLRELALGQDIEHVTLLDLHAAEHGAASPGGRTAEELAARPIYTETWYPRLHLGWSELTSLVEDDLHLIDGPDPELYDLGEDPAETRSLLRDRRRDYARLRDRLAGLERELEAPADVDPETAKQLAALGYLSTSAAPLGDGPLPDPKANLHVLDNLMEAFRLFRRQDFAAAADTFHRVTEANPGMTDAWEHLGLSLRQIGRYPEAEAAYIQAMELTGGADHIALGLARLYTEMGRLDDARKHAELALDTNVPAAQQVLAEIALTDQDWPGVESHARAALDAKPGNIAAFLLLAQAAIEGDDLDEAQRLADQAQAEQAKRFDDQETTPGLYFLRGEILARRGQAEQAEAAYLEEIRRHPLDTRSYGRLAVLYALLGRSAEATGILRRMTEAYDAPIAYAAAVETLRVLGDQQQAARLLQFALSRFPGDPKLSELAKAS